MESFMRRYGMKENPIRELLSCKVRVLTKQFYESKILKHNPTIGNLREEYIRGILEKLIPQNFKVGSGFVVHSHNNKISPQIDLVVADKSKSPDFNLSQNIELFPIETVYTIIEIKSELTNKCFTQVLKQNKKICEMKYSLFGKGLPLSVIPSMIVAYKCNLNDDAIKEAFGNNNNLKAVCIIGKSCYLSTINGIEIIKSNDMHTEVCEFVGYLYRVLVAQKYQNRQGILTNWATYVSDIEPSSN
jgi:hypothetical protein